MPNPVCTGDLLMCSFGAAPSAFSATPGRTVQAQGKLVGNIMDNKPLVNIKPCGVCSSMANPAVAVATAAALGVLTPQPCVPVPCAPWVGACRGLVEDFPAVTSSSKLMCQWGGVINPVMTGAKTITVE